VRRGEARDAGVVVRGRDLHHVAADDVAASPRSTAKSSRVVMPATSGVPVPGACDG
jgi:hypothetical protein